MFQVATWVLPLVDWVQCSSLATNSSLLCLLTTSRANYQMLPAGSLWQNKVLAIAQMHHSCRSPRGFLDAAQGSLVNDWREAHVEAFKRRSDESERLGVGTKRVSHLSFRLQQEAKEKCYSCRMHFFFLFLFFTSHCTLMMNFRKKNTKGDKPSVFRCWRPN